MSSLEEIKLMVEYVKHKKIEGTLYLMGERIAWMPKTEKSGFTISHHYVDIKNQKISAEGNSKIQLQVVLHDDTSSVFHFKSPEGVAKQREERDKCKDLLASLLPKFKQKISKELEEKKRILIENPNVYQLYNDLVVGGIVSADTFWKNFVDFNKFKMEAKNQLTGVSQGFMSNIVPKSDGSNGLVYNILPDDIQSVFKTYPAVKLKYVQNVPNKMSEKEFWTKFFQSYYIRRDQINSATNDLFADCSVKDSDEIKAKSEKIIHDPLIVLDSQRDLSKDDGFGLNEFLTNRSTANSQNLVKRYNYYSMRVLSSMEENVVTKDDSNEEKQPLHKKIRLDEEISDLNSDEANLKGAKLNLTHIDRYFFAPKLNESNQSILATNLLKNLDLKTECENTLKQTKDWNLNVQKLTNHQLAITILVDLSPGSLLMQSNGVQNLKDEIPKHNQEEVKAIYISSFEMLKSFHGMFPPKNSEQELKLKSMKESLDAYFQQKILPLHERLSKENFSWNLTCHLEKMFQIGFSKYNTWQKKQAG